MSNEIVLITGVSNGIGSGLAKAYAHAGFIVIGCDIDDHNGQQLADDISSKGGSMHFFSCDVRNPEMIRNVFLETKERVGIPSILINNAGISEFKNMFELELEEWENIIHTNLRSVFLFSKQAANLWKTNGIKGRIVNIASTRAFMSEPDSEGYAASKGGVIGLTHAMAASLSPHSIRVNSISPGWIHTGDIKQLREIDHKQHLSNRVGKVEDIAKACLYVTDQSNDFVNAENLVIDGGMTRKMIYEH